MAEKERDRIAAQSFSRTFEKMCNFMAVAKTGDPQTTVRGLVKLCLLELPDDNFQSARSIQETIETLYGLNIPESQIETALGELERNGVIVRPGNTNYRLSPEALSQLRNAVTEANELESRVKAAWLQQLETSHPDLPGESAWKVLRKYLMVTFRRHGIQAAALVDPAVETPNEHEGSLRSILADAIKQNGLIDDDLRSNAEDAVSGFMASLGTDSDRVKYIAQLADGAFNFFTLEVPADLSTQLRQQLRELVLFLDTNFLFGILDLHFNTQVQVSHDLIRAIREHKLPFKLRFHEATHKEMVSTISHYGSVLRSRPWTRSLSRAASNSGNLSGIEQKFHERNAEGLIDVDEFLRPYEHFDNLFEEKGIKIYRPNADRPDAQNELYHDYRKFLDANRREDKSYETVMHDAKVLEEARVLRTKANSSLEAGALLISCDYFLYRYDWESSRKAKSRACVLLPNMFWQVLRPFIPADQDFEKAFAETFALPEFRAIGSGGARACSKMLRILATYKEVPEQTAFNLLANDLLLDRLRTENDDAKFEEQVAAAFVEENKGLLEEKAGLEKALRQERSRAEEEASKRKEVEGAAEELRKQVDGVGVKLNAAEQAMKEREQAANSAVVRAEAAEKEAEAARKSAKLHADLKANAESRAFYTSVIAGGAFGFAVALAFVVITHRVPWTWLIAHKNAIPLQIGVCATLLLASFGLFVGAWRKWCWGVGVISFILTMLSMMGN